MKEAYFLADKISTQALGLFRSLQISGRRNLSGFRPELSALLVLDMQRYFLEETSHAFVPSAPAILSNLQLLILAYQRAGLPVVFTRHLNDEQNAAQMAAWWREVLSIENPLSEITAGLNAPENAIMSKSQYDAFYQTGLEDFLRQKNIQQVVVCGVMTHLCCETTARSAFVRGFQVYFTVDGTATYNMEFHRATLVNLSHGFAVLSMCKDLAERVEGCRHG